MSDKLKKQVAVELEQLNQLVDSYFPLLNNLSDEAPAYFERAALATMLHGFYTGVENADHVLVRHLGLRLDHHDDIPGKATEVRQKVRKT